MRQVLFIGACLVDELFYATHAYRNHTSNPARFQKSVGGVVTNLARHAALMGIPSKIISHVGLDSDGRFLEHCLLEAGVNTHLLQKGVFSTGKFTAFIEPDGSLFSAACSDNTALAITDVLLEKMKPELAEAVCIMADTNLHKDTLNYLMQFSATHDIPLIIEPVSVAKAEKLKCDKLNGVYMITPNEDELESITGSRGEAGVQELLRKGVNKVWLRKGGEGSVFYTSQGKIQLPAPSVVPVDTTGAGDAALAGWLYAFLKNKNDLSCIAYGHALAAGVLMQHGTVIEDLNTQIMEQLKQQFYPDVH
jgi:pseudouridine kinase